MNELDILNRSPIVERIIEVLHGISVNKQSMTFSLNGKWGSGKSFVLNMLANRIKEENENSSDCRQIHLKIPSNVIKYIWRDFNVS